ncbi:hypothetical protein L6164_031342 [Bauhinia variegata]|uniref:Uncharacterized protein n=1 Tax=Bauhinia variegata TaxID=167791 RepID=A0ACB9LGH7_BAUVA|nr:hypothetical protein L6164_031342 [Bauhinia variegata]
MDQRLPDAAKLGDIVELQNILQEDPLVLEEVSVIPFAQTPLHVAALAGKDDFVEEIIKLMPSFAKEINEKGLSPMHIACAKGYCEIVSELLKLKLDVNLCLFKYKHGRTPLHYAIIKGKVDVVKMLISDYPQSVEEVTAQNETVLHLAVKGNQFTALKVLIEKLLGELNKFNMLLCAKDKEGNTVSELAETISQPEVRDLLKENGLTGAGNAKVSGVTQEKGDGNGILMELLVPNMLEENDTKITIHGDDHQLVVDKSKKKTLKGLSNEVKHIVLIVATVLTNMTYQAGLSPPETILKERAKLNTPCHFKKQYIFSLLGSFQACPAADFYIFMICNTAGFLASLSMIIYLSPEEFQGPSASWCCFVSWGLFYGLCC